MKFIPDDLNAEELLAYLPEGSCKVAIQGLHQRNVYHDILELSPLAEKEGYCLALGRNGLYSALPEVLFHQVDRFSNLPAQNEKERFDEEYALQEQEKENAMKFFLPIDLMLFMLKTDAHRKMAQMAEYDQVLENILGDRLTPKMRENPFISQLIHFLPACKYIRGNKTLLTLMLRKVLIEEGLTLQVEEEKVSCSDSLPRYDNTVGSILGEGFLGQVYDDTAVCYTLHYWPEDQCDGDFMKLMDNLEEMRQFVQDYFLSVEEVLRFEISHDAGPLRLSDDLSFNYLNYNANLG